MALSISMSAYGSPDVLDVVHVDPPPPGAGEVRLRQSAIGVNFVDIYHRTGLYPVPSLPATPGVEGAGIVEAVGAGVSDFQTGDRVVYAGLPIGGYAAVRNISAGRLVAIPDDIDDLTAAAAMLRGITAHMLLCSIYPVSAGSTILVHAAAGGLGRMLTQWGKSLGARVIGTTGSRAKAEIATASGADHIILYQESDFVTEVLRLTGGAGVDVAYDGIGGDILMRTLDCVKPFGTVASIGQASGCLPALGLDDIGPRRSLALACPSVFRYASDTARYKMAAAATFDKISSGLAVAVDREMALAQAKDAHMLLGSGSTMGAIILRP